MSLPLQDQELALLHRQFHLPDKTTAFDGSKFNEYELHECLSTLHPEDALLCIALCLNMLIVHKDVPAYLSDGLRPLTHSILEKYGQNALDRLNVTTSTKIRENITTVTKDLASLTRTLENLEPAILQIPNMHIAAIFSALCIQAGAQKEIAQFVLDNQFNDHRTTERPIDEEDTIPFAKTPPVNDNRQFEA